MKDREIMGRAREEPGEAPDEGKEPGTTSTRRPSRTATVLLALDEAKKAGAEIPEG